ncbi:TPA: hypothetical protein ACF3PO_005460, partial [Pseudomonas aeruginosa]
ISRDGILTFGGGSPACWRSAEKPPRFAREVFQYFGVGAFLFISKNNFPLSSKNEKAQGKK